MWIIDMPSGDHSAYGCDRPSYVTAQEAKGHLDRNDFAESRYATTPDCLDRLREIASGDADKHQRKAWFDSLKFGALALAILFAIIYALGYGLGWVWRGFFPKKQTTG